MTTLKNTPFKTFKKVLLVAACSTLGAISVNAQADDVSVPDTIRWTIPFGVGGGTDVWARFFTTWMSDHIEGNPTLVIDNVPGGGSINGSNLFAMRADSDGSQWIGTSASTQYPAMLQDRRVRYSYDDWTPILATPTGGVVYAQPGLGDSAEEVLNAVTNQRVKFAVQSHTGLELPVLIALDLLGADVQAVSGMRSRGEGRLAFERGEAYRKFFASGFTLQKLILLPNDAPEALIQEYRDAARRFVDTEAFKEAAMAQLGPYTPVVGEVVEQHLQDAMSLDDATRQWLVEWLLEQHGARI